MLYHGLPARLSRRRAMIRSPDERPRSGAETAPGAWALCIFCPIQAGIRRFGFFGSSCSDGGGSVNVGASGTGSTSNEAGFSGTDCATGGSTGTGGIGVAAFSFFAGSTGGIFFSGNAVCSDFRSTNFAFSGGYGASCALQTKTSVTRPVFSAFRFPTGTTTKSPTASGNPPVR